jgi:hypothetical protein
MTSGAFSMGATRDEFVQAAESREDIAARARAIDAWLEPQGVHVVASYGVGGATLEWWLHRLRPDRALVVTEYGEATLTRLGELFPEVDARYHDLVRDAPLEADVHLFHRVDTELSNDQWRVVFQRFRSARILVVAGAVLDARSLALELINRPRLRLRRASSAGFIRTRGALEALWEETHTGQRLRMYDLDAWWLMPASAAG